MTVSDAVSPAIFGIVRPSFGEVLMRNTLSGPGDKPFGTSLHERTITQGALVCQGWRLVFHSYLAKFT